MRTKRFRKFAILGVLIASIGCEWELTSVSTSTTPPDAPVPANPMATSTNGQTKAEPVERPNAAPNSAKSELPTGFAGNEMFQPPVRLKAGDEFVSVESPGYACPTFHDVDGDGKKDLVVGQFNNGNMQFCKNIASTGQPPKFASPQWLTTGEERAEVPGVW